MFTAYLTRRVDYFEQDIIALRNEKFKTFGAEVIDPLKAKSIPVDPTIFKTEIYSPHKMWVGNNFEETFKLHKNSLIQFAVIVGYYVIGIIYYNSAEGWDMNQCMFFITTTITQIGYAYVHPTTDGSRIFTIFYIFFGLLTVYAILNARIQQIIIDVENKIMDRVNKMERVHDITLQLFTLIYFTLCLLIFTLIGAAIFKSFDLWSYTESYYFTVTTMSGVGYGDLPFEGEDLYAYTTVFMLFTVTATTVFIEKADLLLKFNPKGQVSALEFLVGLLTYADVIDKEKDIDPILKKFIALDTDKDGLLSIDDLKRFRDAMGESKDVSRGPFGLIYDDFCEVFMGSNTNDASATRLNNQSSSSSAL